MRITRSPHPLANPLARFDAGRIRGHHEDASRTGCETRNCHLTAQQTRLLFYAFAIVWS